MTFINLFEGSSNLVRNIMVQTWFLIYCCNLCTYSYKINMSKLFISTNYPINSSLFSTSANSFVWVFSVVGIFKFFRNDCISYSMICNRVLTLCCHINSHFIIYLFNLLIIHLQILNEKGITSIVNAAKWMEIEEEVACHGFPNHIWNPGSFKGPSVNFICISYSSSIGILFPFCDFEYSISTSICLGLVPFKVFSFTIGVSTSFNCCTQQHGQVSWFSIFSISYLLSCR